MPNTKSDVLSALISFDIIKTVEEHRANERREALESDARSHEAYREMALELIRIGIDNVFKIVDVIQEEWGFADTWYNNYNLALIASLDCDEYGLRATDVKTRPKEGQDIFTESSKRIKFHKDELIKWFNTIEPELNRTASIFNELQAALDFPTEWGDEYQIQLNEILEPLLLVPGAPDQTQELVRMLHFHQQKMAKWKDTVISEWGHLRETLGEVQENLNLADQSVADRWSLYMGIFEKCFCFPKMPDRSSELVRCIHNNCVKLIEWHNSKVSKVVEDSEKVSSVDDWGEV